MKRKTIGAVLLFAAALTGLWAGGEKEAAVAAEGPETVTYYLWEDPTYKDIIDTFNEKYGDEYGVYVDAKQISSGEYETKISTLLAGGVEMDAYMQKRQTDMFPHHANGYLAPLDDLITAHEFDLEAISAYHDQLKVDGTIYAIPFRGSAYYVYYNRKVFERAGEPLPATWVDKGEWTWEKFKDVAGRLATGDGEVYGGLLYTWGSCHAVPAVQAGNKFIRNDGTMDIDDSVLYSFQLRKELERNKSIIPLLEMKVTKTHYSQAFYQGNVGMLVIGEWFPGFMITGRDDNLLQGFSWNDWGITRLPSNEPEYSTYGASTFNHIHAKSKRKDAAFKFIGWMGGPEGAVAVARAGFLPAMITPEVKQQLAESVPDEESLRYFTEGAQVNALWYNKYGSKVEQLWSSLMEEYLVGDLSDDDLMVKYRKGLEEIIATTN